MASLQWAQANPFSISLDLNKDVWNAGHINDILAIGYSVLVASDSGGVWIINPGIHVHGLGRYPATCISDGWLQDGMSSLAFGPDGNTQVFAAAWSGPIVYAITLTITARHSVVYVKSVPISLPGAAGGVDKIVVQKESRHIIAACSNGVWWAKIPAVFDQASSYSWHNASGLPAGGYSSLALGPGTSVVAAAWGSNPNTGLYGLFTGTWNNTQTDLVFSRASINGSDATKMLRASVASCAGDKTHMFAVSGGANDTIFNVLKSSDGGKTWTPANIPANPGNQEFWNNCIDVHPSDPSSVAIGWRGGPFVSHNAASTWTTVSGSGLHSDLHVVYWPNITGDPNALFVGSDGGVALVSGISGAINSAYNIHLLNLQLYGRAGNASYQFAGLYSVGTQDNGNVMCLGDAQPWAELEGGDGGTNRFLRTGHLLRFNNTLVVNGVEIGNRVRAAKWDPQAKAFDGGPWGTVVPVDGTTDGLGYPVLEIVNAPQYIRNGQVMLAVAGGTDSVWKRNLYGLFADGAGNGMHWIHIATVPATVDISALGSSDGKSVIVGTAQGRILWVDSSTGTVTDMAQSAPLKRLNGSGAIAELLIQSDSLMFALHAAGYVIRFAGGTWNVLPALPKQTYQALETDWTVSPKTVFVATDTAVFASHDNGVSWTNQTQGLPVSPHADDLRFVVQPDQEKFLYLGTYGRSLWRAKVVPQPAQVPSLPFPASVTHILWGVIQDGGGWTFPGGPVPPWGPEEGLLIGALASSLAKSLPGSSGAVRNVSALQSIAVQAADLLKQAGGTDAAVAAAVPERPKPDQEEGESAKTKDKAEPAAEGGSTLASILKVIENFQGAAGPDQELVLAILAASLARRQGGTAGDEGLKQALGFIIQKSQ